MSIKVTYREARHLYAAGWAIWLVDAAGYAPEIIQWLELPCSGYKRAARRCFGLHAKDCQAVEFYAAKCV